MTEAPRKFLAEIENRPGLSAFDYRIGTYSSMRAHMLDGLVKAPALAGWTHLSSDDPGVAILEGAAIVGDVLTLYQEIYANETKLPTASWDESIVDLIKLTGYRPAPALGGTALFALEVESDGPVKVLAGFPFEASLEGFDKPSRFESEAAVTAYEAFNDFHLYRPRLDPQPIAKGATTLDVVRVGTATDLKSRAAVELSKGDRVILFSGPFDPHEILTVKSVEEKLDRVTVEFDGAVQADHPAQVTAFKLKATHRHHGADAQDTFSFFQENPPRTVVIDTEFDRPLNAASASGPYYDSFAPQEIPLDAEVDDLAAGARVVCVGRSSANQDFTLLRRVRKVTPRSAKWANLSVNSTVATLDLSLRPDLLVMASAKEFAAASGPTWALDASVLEAALAGVSGGVAFAMEAGAGEGAAFKRMTGDTAGGVLQMNAAKDTATIGEFEMAASVVAPLVQLFDVLEVEIVATHDIRRFRMHQTDGPGMVMAAPPVQQSGAPVDGVVNFFGTRDEADALAGRRLLLVDGARTEEVTVAARQPKLQAEPAGVEGDERMWPIQLSTAPTFAAATFDETDPKARVRGNLVAATEGATEAETAIGSGDARKTFQTFALKKPLTFLPDAAGTPPYAPELEIRVNGRLWSPVDAFFGAAADDEVFVLRKDEDGVDVVQFGDGIEGARPASGRSNVTAAYRTGAGARGDLAEGVEPKGKGKLKALKKVAMPAPVTGGADAEKADGAREAAPARTQALGRIVGLSDYEAEALTIPGVLKAGATFAADPFAPAVDVTVLTEDDSDAAVASVAAALRLADRRRGAGRHAVRTIRGRLRAVALTLEFAHDPALKATDVAAGIEAALGATPEEDPENAPEGGLFSLDARGFGEDAHVSQAIAAAQNVSGVDWVRVIAFAPLIRRAAPLALKPTLRARLKTPYAKTLATLVTTFEPMVATARPPSYARIRPGPAEVLALSTRDLTLRPVSVASDDGGRP